MAPKNLSYKAIRYVTAAQIFAIFAIRYYATHSDPDSLDRIVNFAVSWLPFVISLVIAFIPSLEKERRAHMKWRIGVVIAGTITSLLMWYQVSRNYSASIRQQKEAVNTAVQQSNQHADQQIGAVRQDVQGMKADLETKISDVISKSTSSLSESIGKATKPKPPELAQLKFSVYAEDIKREEIPVLTTKRSVDNDGNVAVEVFFINTSEVPADALDVWLIVCELCCSLPSLFNLKKSPGWMNTSGTDLFRS